MPAYVEEALEEWDEEYHDLAATGGNDVQGVEPNAKDDTLYYGRDSGGGIADLATDKSQYLDNQTTGATWHYESSPATRFNVTSPWTIDVDIDAKQEVSSGFLMHYGSGSGALELRINASEVVEGLLGGAVVISLALPGVAVGNKRYVITWAAEPNPLTTGASDAVRSELRIHNLTDGTYAQAIATHVERTTGTGNFIWWASSTAGATPFLGTPHACRFSAARMHPTSETKEDFVVQTPAPVLLLATRCESPIVDPSCLLGGTGQFAGPVHFMGAQAVKASNLRLLSPIVNEHYLNRPEINGSSYAAIPTQFRDTIPDALYKLLGSFMFYRPVPPIASHLRVRLLLKTWKSSGDAIPNQIRLRMYSMNRPPVAADVVDLDKACVHTQAEAWVATDHGSAGTNGEWVDLGVLQPTVNSRGCTWLALAVRVVGHEVNRQVFEIGAIVIEPGVIE